MGRAFDIVAIPASGNNPKRSLEQHVKDAHPDFVGDFRDLVGEKVTRYRGRGQGQAQPATPGSIETEEDASATETAFAQSIMKPEPKSDLDYQESGMDFLSLNYGLTVIATHARTKIATIYQKLDNDKPDETVTIGMDRWDQAALEGKIDKDIQKLAEVAFPADLFDHQFTVCSVSDKDVLQHLASYYVEKATRFEDQIA